MKELMSNIITQETNLVVLGPRPCIEVAAASLKEEGGGEEIFCVQLGKCSEWLGLQKKAKRTGTHTCDSSSWVAEA